nr:DUF421 domain-containing protein [Alteribacillus iranensis]
MDRKLFTKNKLDVNQVLSILRQNNVFSVAKSNTVYWKLMGK